MVYNVSKNKDLVEDKLASNNSLIYLEKLTYVFGNTEIEIGEGRAWLESSGDFEEELFLKYLYFSYGYIEYKDSKDKLYKSIINNFKYTPDQHRTDITFTLFGDNCPNGALCLLFSLDDNYIRVNPLENHNNSTIYNPKIVLYFESQ